MIVLLVELVASLLVVAKSQSSDLAVSANLEGFLSKYEDLSAYSRVADALKIPHGNYNKFLIPSLNHVKHGNQLDALSHRNKPYEHDPVDGSSVPNTADRPFMVLDTKPSHTTVHSVNWKPKLSINDHGSVNVVDRKIENLEVEKMLASQKANTDTGLMAIGMTLLAFATAFAVRFRRECRRVPVLDIGAGSDMLLPASHDHALELKSQGSTIIGDAGSRQRFEAAVYFIEPQRQEVRGSSSASSNLRNTVAAVEEIETQPQRQEDRGSSSASSKLRECMALLDDADLLPASHGHSFKLKSKGSTISGDAESRQRLGAAVEEIEECVALLDDADLFPASHGHSLKLKSKGSTISRNAKGKGKGNAKGKGKGKAKGKGNGKAKGRIAAVLDADGTGRICVKSSDADGWRNLDADSTGHMEDFEYPPADDDIIDFAARQMERLHYRMPGETVKSHILAPAVAKFWYANELGSVTVYPYSMLLHEMRNAWLHDAGKQWLSCEEEFAFVIPRSSPSARMKREYGGSQSASFATGGGPFVLKDSDTMVEEMLHKLGYMDTSLNSDLHESIQVFSRMKYNKESLRRVGLKPADLESYPSSMSALRGALLSNECGGHWQPAPGDAICRDYLVAKGLLPEEGATKEDVLQVLKKHSARLGLPNLKTYNGYVQSFFSYLDPTQPNMRRQ